MNNRNALRMHAFISLALFSLSVHDCIQVSSDVSQCLRATGNIAAHRLCSLCVSRAPTCAQQIGMSDKSHVLMLLDYGDELVIAAVTATIQGFAAVCIVVSGSSTGFVSTYQRSLVVVHRVVGLERYRLVAVAPKACSSIHVVVRR
jgi:hypothetical protein